MWKILLVCILSFLWERSSSATCSNPKGPIRGTAKDFQIYQLALTWAPEFCSNQNKEQCDKLAGTWGATHLTIHGLWPGYQNDNGGDPWPQKCPCVAQTCTVDEKTWSSQLRADLTKYAPGYVTDHTCLAHHEWKKHGACTGFNSPNEFFQVSVNTLRQIPLLGGHEGGTPNIILQNIGKRISKADLKKAYPKKTGFSCKGSLTGANAECRLSDVFPCYTSTNPPVVGKIVDCPQWMLDDDYTNSCDNKPNRCPNGIFIPQWRDDVWKPDTSAPTPIVNPSVTPTPVAPVIPQPEPAPFSGDGGAACPAVRDKPRGNWGEFDLYQLGLTWAPQFCSNNANKNKEQCQQLSGTWATNHFSIHGLWPAYLAEDSSNQWPQVCPCDPDVDTCDVDPSNWSSELRRALTTYGPGYVTDNYCLAQHEWKKHGTCTGFSTPNDYFITAVNTLFSIEVNDEGTPDFIINNIGKTVKQDQLKKAFPKKTALQCDGCKLSAALTCFSASSPPYVGANRDCPSWVLNSNNNNCFKNNCPKGIEIPEWDDLVEASIPVAPEILARARTTEHARARTAETTEDAEAESFATTSDDETCPPLRDNARGTTGEFEIYQLSLSWAPQFCSSKKNKNKGECRGLKGSWGATHLTLHGLWPAYRNDNANHKNQWPQVCDCENSENQECNVDHNTWSDSNLLDDLTKFAPGYVTDNNCLAVHEWSKHGTCTGFASPNEFFTTAIQVMSALPGQGTPALIVNNVGRTVSQDALERSFSRKAAFACEQGCKLKEILVCYRADPPNVGQRIDCPKWVLSGSSNSCLNNDCPNGITIVRSK